MKKTTFVSLLAAIGTYSLVVSAFAQQTVYNPNQPNSNYSYSQQYGQQQKQQQQRKSRLGARNGKSSVLSGPRAEIRLGYDSFDTGAEQGDGAIFGFSLGYDKAVNNFVMGVFTGFDWSTTSFDSGLDTGRDLEIGLKGGYAINSRIVLYTLLSLVNSQFATGTGEGFNDGIRYGLGAEYFFNSRYFSKLQYNYTDYHSSSERQQIMTSFGMKF